MVVNAQQLYNSPTNSTEVQFLTFPINDSGAFDSGAFDSTAFDSTAFDSTDFDSGAFDTTAFDSTAFDSTDFDSTAFDSTAFDSSMFDFGFLEVLKFMEKEEGTTGMMVFCICNVIILFLLNMEITKIYDNK